MTLADFFARWRVRLGYILAVVLLLLASPTPQTIVLGGMIGLLGLVIRAYAAGFLHKQEILTTTGPYAYTRNPLYFGSSFLAILFVWALVEPRRVRQPVPISMETPEHAYASGVRS